MISIEEYNKISNKLLSYHELFYKFWTVGCPVVNNNIDTCAIGYNKAGDFVTFVFNENFWNFLTLDEKVFSICHELLHVILNHGKRMVNIIENPHTNIAADIVVNNMLKNNLGLTISERVRRSSCFIDTVFKDTSKIQKCRSFEYYLNELNKNPNNLKFPKSQSHKYLIEIDCDKIIEKTLDLKPNSEKPKPKPDIEGGTETLNNLYELYKQTIKNPPNWQNLLKSIVTTKKVKATRHLNRYNWVKPNRRYSLMDKDILLPSFSGDVLDDKIELWFFQDISGSTIHLKDKFVSVARSIPLKIFNVRFFTFDTQVKEIPLNTKTIEGGGGTAFSIIEEFIQQKIRLTEEKYPTVIVITDGDGDHVEPKIPKNWHWILTKDSRSCFPKECHSIVMDNL